MNFVSAKKLENLCCSKLSR